MALQARHPDGEQMTVAQLAADTGVNQPTIAKLMKQLTQAGIVTSQRGANGGYTLGRTAAEISVTEIIEALEGPIELTSCVDGAETNCGVENLCPMRGNWDRVNGAIRGALAHAVAEGIENFAWVRMLALGSLNREVLIRSAR